MSTIPRGLKFLHVLTAALFSLSFVAIWDHSHGAVIGEHQDCLMDRRVPGGSFVIAGGGCVTDETRRKFIELAGGVHSQIVVIPAIDPEPGTEGEWLAPWHAAGATNVELCNARNRQTANDPAFCAHLSKATGVWFSGGYQELLAKRYVDTAAQTCLHDVLNRNGVVGGCSAGAAILSRVGLLPKKRARG